MRFKFLTSSVFFFFICLTLSAQTLVGIKGGLNLSNFNGAYPALDPRLGFHGGLFIQETLEGKSNLRLELQYSQKGARQDVTTSRKLNGKDRLLINYNYVEMPIIVNYTLFEKLSPYVGVQPGFLVKTFVHLKGSSTDYSGGFEPSKGKMAVVGGVEYMLTKKLGVDVRYDRHLLGKGDKSHALQAGLAIYFNK
jgi:opacity protein-like surface antigen